ncbi:unnamed protein product [Amoebophrya sp. A25]|nr:unnamed protein product [Amoebophrya sp. A25]|eukprot:GSA25T00021234001.1
MDVMQCVQVVQTVQRSYDPADLPERLNGTLSIRCQPGYVFRSGHPEAFCDATGEWYSGVGNKKTKLVQPQCELDADFCPEPRGVHAYIKRYYDSPNNARGLDTKVELGCDAGYVNKYGDADIICNMNLVGTEGLWYSIAYQQVAAKLICEIDLEFCPAIPVDSSYVIERDDGRFLGALYRRSCAEGFVKYAGDDEVVCGNEGIWKTRTGTGTNLRNAQILTCVAIEQYCPLPILSHGSTANRVQKLGDKALVQCLPAFDRLPTPQRMLRCVHYAGNATFTTRTGTGDYQISALGQAFAYDGYWVVDTTNGSLPIYGPHFACTAIGDFCVAPAASTLVYSLMTGNSLNPMGAGIQFRCLTGYLPSFGSSELFCGISLTPAGQYGGIWIQADGIPGIPLACSGSKEVCPDVGTITANSQGYYLKPLDRSLNSRAYLRCKMGYDLSRAYTPTRAFAKHRMVYQCCVLLDNSGNEFGFWSNVVGLLNSCPTTLAGVPNRDSCELIEDFCPAPDIDPNMEDLSSRNLLTYFDASLRFTYGSTLSLSCPEKKELVHGDAQLVCTAQDDNSLPGKWRRWVNTDYTPPASSFDQNFTATEDGMGVRSVRSNFVPVACAFERQYGIKLRATYKSELTARRDAPGTEAVDSVRYQISQESSDYDEEAFSGHILAPETGIYTFKLELFGRARVFLERALLMSVASSSRATDTSTTKLFESFVSRPVYLEKGELYSLSVQYEYYVTAIDGAPRQPYSNRFAVLRLKWKTPVDTADTPWKIVPPASLYHSASPLPDYPLRVTVLNDPVPCLPAPLITRHRHLQPLRFDATTNTTIGYETFSGILSHTQGTDPYQRYNPNAACYIELTTLETRQYKFKFQLDWMDIEYSDGCVFDMVKIWRGVWRGTGSPRQLLCGENRRDELLFEEDGNAYFIEFYTNDAYESQGFQINYTVMERDVTNIFR